ncbi:hypothetical protein SSX86_017057 [Deinandra increscens subsp. villosa]|uniref:Probable RNA-binding protein 18 n=1 Tax=Deinandra increscens subsp. villosa TaxID=3103831 RepID=A0AAP0CZE5_9ASTR
MAFEACKRFRTTPPSSKRKLQVEAISLAVEGVGKDKNVILDDKSESRLYVGNLDLRITEAARIKMFSPFGNIVFEDFLWHTCGPKRGEPRGYAFVQFSTKEEAKLAKEKMHGKLACGRPLVVRFASDKYLTEMGAKMESQVAAASQTCWLPGRCLGSRIVSEVINSEQGEPTIVWPASSYKIALADPVESVIVVVMWYLKGEKVFRKCWKLSVYY